MPQNCSIVVPAAAAAHGWQRFGRSVNEQRSRRAVPGCARLCVGCVSPGAPCSAAGGRVPDALALCGGGGGAMGGGASQYLKYTVFKHTTDELEGKQQVLAETVQLKHEEVEDTVRKAERARGEPSSPCSRDRLSACPPCVAALPRGCVWPRLRAPPDLRWPSAMGRRALRGGVECPPREVGAGARSQPARGAGTTRTGGARQCLCRQDGRCAILPLGVCARSVRDAAGLTCELRGLGGQAR